MQGQKILYQKAPIIRENYKPRLSLQPKTFLLDIIKLMAHKMKQPNDVSLYDILAALDF